MVGASMVVCKVRVGGPRAKRPWAAEARWALVGRDRASMVMFCMARDGRWLGYGKEGSRW